VSLLEVYEQVAGPTIASMSALGGIAVIGQSLLINPDLWVHALRGVLVQGERATWPSGILGNLGKVATDRLGHVGHLGPSPWSKNDNREVDAGGRARAGRTRYVKPSFARQIGDVHRYSPCLFVRARSLNPTFVKHLSPVFTASGP
jgi:hypothetical protein